MKIIQQKSAGLFLMVLIACLFTLSCQNKSKKVSEKMVENAIENATGKDAEVNFTNEKTVIESGENQIVIDGKATSWPNDIPDEIPELKQGKIEAVTTSIVDGSNTWTIAFKEVPEGFLDKYEAQLKKNGFETTIIKTGDKGGSIMAETEKYFVFLMGGEGTVSLAVNIKSPE